MGKSNEVIFSFREFLRDKNVKLPGFECFEKGEADFCFSGRLFNSTFENLSESYMTKGFDAFSDIDGDFLLVIRESEKLHFVRDRHGVGSQLFYSESFFSMSLIGFAQSSEFECKPDKDALMTFLSIGYIPSPMTSVSGVSKLSPGYAMTYHNGTISTYDMFSVEEYMKNAASAGISEKEAVANYEKLHKAAISSRIKHLTKVGLLLSGGYDSGGNISALRDLYQGDVVTYSIGFRDNPWTELPLARILSERYKTRHYEYEIDGSEIMQLPQIIRETGDPFQEGGLLVNFTAMQLVRQSGESPGVILGGDGNDQHFGTSGKELAMHWKIRSKGLQILQNLYDWLGDRISLFEKDNIFFRTQFHNRKILHIQQSDTFGFTLKSLRRMSSVGFKMRKLNYLNDHPVRFADFKQFFLSRNINIDIKQVINEVILFKSSRMASLFGGAISFPYMSTDLYRFLNTMPVEYKFKGSLDELTSGKGISKYLHKTYLYPRLPAGITERKKQGGFAPLPIFLKDDKQRLFLFDFIRNSEAVQNLFKPKYIDKLLKQYDEIVKSKPYWFWFQQVKANQIINLLTLAVWWEMLIKGKTQVENIKELIKK